MTFFKLFLYLQAVDEVNRGHIRADERLYQLKALQDSSKKQKVTLIRKLIGFEK
jgi:hypothetical protein